MAETFNKMELLNKYSRYYLVNLAFAWAKQIIAKKEKNRILSEIVDEVIADIMEGKISPEEIENILSEKEDKEKV